MLSTPSASLKRPPTSTPRGICRYYTTDTGCHAGTTCKFLHSTQQDAHGNQPLLTPYDRAKRCLFYAKGYCKREENCWFKHELPPAPGIIAVSSTSASGLDEPEPCGICLEVPITYGLLEGCNHVFCIHCIRQWRKKNTEDYDSAASKKKCPMCRTPSKFVAPSSMFCAASAVSQRSPATGISPHPASAAGVENSISTTMTPSHTSSSTPITTPSTSEGTTTYHQLSPSAPAFVPSGARHSTAEAGPSTFSTSSPVPEASDGSPRSQLHSKHDIIASYKASMKRIPCRHFLASSRRSCKFRNDCFYQHVDADGNEVIFPPRSGARPSGGGTGAAPTRPTFTESLRNGLVQFLLGFDRARNPLSAGGITGVHQPTMVGSATQNANPRDTSGNSQRTVGSTEGTMPGAFPLTSPPQLPSNPAQDMLAISDEDIDAVLGMLNAFQEDLFALRDNVVPPANQVEEDEPLTFNDLDVLSLFGVDSSTSGGETPMDLEAYNFAHPIDLHLTHSQQDDVDLLPVESGGGPQQASSSGNNSSQATNTGPEPEEISTTDRLLSTSPPVPPFLTDGRGRVVWSGSGNGDEEEEPTVGPRNL